MVIPHLVRPNICNQLKLATESILIHDLGIELHLDLITYMCSKPSIILFGCCTSSGVRYSPHINDLNIPGWPFNFPIL